MIYLIITMLAISQLILTILFIRFRRRVKTLFLKLTTYDELQDIDIQSLKSRVNALSAIVHSDFYKKYFKLYG